jgi:glycosyltransferase involved in cell wall biosynthesis
VREQLGFGDDIRLCAAAGRLVRKKGFEYLLDAIGCLPGLVLAIAGEGTLRAELTERARAAGVLERVRFLGNQTQDRVADLFAAADLICVPSVRDDNGNVDGLPNVVLEALASGTPVVCTTAGGIGSVVEDGRTALVVRERDAAALAAAMGRLVADAGLSRSIGTAARTSVHDSFGWERTVARFEVAYDRALAFNSRRS